MHSDNTNNNESGNALNTLQRGNALVERALLFYSILASIIIIILMMNNTTGPAWDPNGSVPFLTWIREVQAWLNVTSSRLTPPQQAAALQLGMRGLARDFALAIPPAVIQFWCGDQRNTNRPSYVPAMVTGESLRSP